MFIIVNVTLICAEVIKVLMLCQHLPKPRVNILDRNFIAQKLSLTTAFMKSTFNALG